MLIELDIPPGVYRNGTQYQTLGRWWDASLVRWYEGTIQPVGGWMKPASTIPQLQGAARQMFSWRDNTQNRWMAIGTHSNLYVYNGGSIYDITPAGLTVGREDAFYGAGYGFGPYNAGLYGAPPANPPTLDATTWSFDNWGQYLVGCSTGDGNLYQWNINVQGPAQLIANAPTKCVGTLVSTERFQFALGANGDPRNIMWSDEGDNTTWTPDTLNLAGDLKVQSQGRIRCGHRFRAEIVVWTDTDVHSVYFMGPPLVYGIRRVGSWCGAISSNAVAILDSGAVWMSGTGFFLYDGGTVSPLQCDIADYLIGNINLIQISKIYAAQNAKFREVWWFYPSLNSDENDSYVVWNYLENHWSIGKLVRLCWEDTGVFNYPMAVDDSGNLYEQEYGWTADGQPLTSQRYAKSGPTQIGASGDRVMSVNQLVPDEATLGQVSFEMRTKLTPEGPETTWGPYNAAEYTDVRVTGRQASLDVYGAADANWRLGRVRMDTIQGGRR
jgi:hypothetical protein